MDDEKADLVEGVDVDQVLSHQNGNFSTDNFDLITQLLTLDSQNFDEKQRILTNFLFLTKILSLKTKILTKMRNFYWIL